MTIICPPPLCARPELLELTIRDEWDYVPLPKRTPITEQSWPVGIRPLASVCCVTFNHEHYIRQAIDGFLMQETTFPVQIVVLDDASSDETSPIIREYEALYPSLFIAVLLPLNLYSQGIRKEVDHLLFGKYIAYCEGDDYWTHPWKLDGQCTYMLNNPDVSLVYHPVLVLNADNEPQRDYTRPPASSNHLECFIAHGNFIHTPSVVRINHGSPLPPEASASPAGDFFQWLLALEHGRMHMIPNTMAVYRWGSGIWSSVPDTQRYIKTITIFFAAREYCFRVDLRAECEILEARISDMCKSVYNHISNEQLYSWSLIGPSSSALVYGNLVGAIKSLHHQAVVKSKSNRYKAAAKSLAMLLLGRK